MIIRPLAVACGVLLFAAPVHAHHGWGSYDAGRALTLQGAVEAVQPGNPHAEIKLRTSGDNKVWRITLSPPFRMTNRGKPIGEIKVGDQVTVVGYPSKVDADEMRAERITHNGVTIELR